MRNQIDSKAEGERERERERQKEREILDLIRWVLIFVMGKHRVRTENGQRRHRFWVIGPNYIQSI
jgi:hypothetical protein